MSMELGLTAASASRVTDILSCGRPGREADGLNLIAKDTDPTNRRRQLLTLTPAGKTLAKQMKTMIYG